MQNYYPHLPRRRALPALAKRSAIQGYFLIEMGLALVVALILLTTQTAKISEALETSLATATGQYMTELQTGLNLYQMKNNDALQAGTPITGFAVPLKPTTAELLTANYLTQGFSPKSPMGLTFAHEFQIEGTCPGIGCLTNGLSYSTTGYSDIGGIVRSDLLAVAVAKIGVDGGQGFPGGGGNITGYAGSFTFPAAKYATSEGMLAIRTGDHSGINALLNQFYKLDGSRALLGTMNANNHDILNIKNLSSTGTATLNDAIINGTLLLTGTAAPGSACNVADTGKLKKNTSSDGLVICNNNVWEAVGNAVSGITVGGACANKNLLGTDAIGLAYVCNGSAWTSLSNFATVGDACAPQGRVATSIATNEQLICKNGQYIRMTSLLTKNVQTGQHIAVQDGTVVAKPVCDLGGTPNYSLTLSQSAVDVSTTPPYQSTYVAAQNNGASWTVLLRLKRSAADGGGEVSGAVYGLSAVMTPECTY